MRHIERKAVVSDLRPDDVPFAADILSAALPHMRTAETLRDELKKPHIVWLAVWSDRSERRSDTASGTPRAPTSKRKDPAVLSMVAVGSIWLLHDEAHIVALAVDPECRRTGYGATLFDALAEIAEQRGALTFLLEVRASNRSARAFYDRLGLQAIARRPGYYPARDGAAREDAIVFRSPRLKDRGWRAMITGLGDEIPAHGDSGR